MTDETVDLTLQRLIRLEKRLDTHDENFREVKHRLSDLETGQASMLSILARMQLSLDRLDERLARMERRLDLTEDAA